MYTLLYKGRILAGCYWFCILIWVSTYTANLAAFFTVKNAEHPINNLEDIVKTSYQVGVLDSSSTSAFFQSSKYETHQKIWQRMERDGTLVKNVDEGVKFVREKDQFVFISDGPMLQHLSNQPPCDLKIGKYRTLNHSSLKMKKHLLLFRCCVILPGLPNR